MKITLLLLSLCAISFAYEASPRRPEPMIVIDSGSTNVPIAYDATAGSQLVAGVASGITRIQAFNVGSELLALYVGKGPCAGVVIDHFVVPSSGGGNEAIAVSPGDHICLRSLGIAQAAGLVTLSQW